MLARRGGVAGLDRSDRKMAAGKYIGGLGINVGGGIGEVYKTLKGNGKDVKQ